MALIAGAAVLVAGVIIPGSGAGAEGDGNGSSEDNKYAERAKKAVDDDTPTMYVGEHGDPGEADKLEKETGSCKNPDHSSLDDAFEEIDKVKVVALCDQTYTIDSDALTVDADDTEIRGNTGEGNLADEPKVTIDESGYEGDGAPFRVTGDNVSLEGIEFAGSPGYALDASDADGLEINQDEFSGKNAGALRATDSEKVTITNNNIATRRGMTLLNNDNVVVASNELSDVTPEGRNKSGIALAGGNDTVDVQGNQLDGSKSAVYVDKADDADSANKDVDVHMNSFGEVDYGVAVTSEDAIAGGKIGARDNYWAWAEQPNEGPGSSANVWIPDGEDVDIDTADQLYTSFSESYTNPPDPEKTATTPKASGDDRKLTMVLFDDPPRKGIADAVGQYVGMAVAGDSDEIDDARVDLGINGKAAPKDMDKNMVDSGSYRNMVDSDTPLRWYDTSGKDSSWRNVSTSDKDMVDVGEAQIDSKSTPSIDELDGAVLVAQDK